VHTRSASPSAVNALSSVSTVGSTTTATTTTNVVETKVQPAQIQTQNAKALLDSVIDAIESPKMGPIPLTPQSSMQSQRQDIPESPVVSDFVDSPTRRNRVLADALFGPQGPVNGPATPTPHPVSQTPTTSPLHISRSVSNEGTVTSNASTPQLTRTPEMTSGMLFMGQLSSPNLTVPDDDELAKQVRAKVEAATMALRKSPSNPKFPDGLGPPIPPATKRKVDRDQISSPTLLSASMSVDTIALQPTSPIHSSNSGLGSNSSGTLKLGQRFRKLRGTLKAKPLPAGGEVSPFPVDLKPSQSISPATSPNLLSQPLVHSGGVSVSSAEHSGSLSAVSTTTVTIEPPVPPAPATSSPGPSLKGFMARFRKNKDKGGDSNHLTAKNSNGTGSMLPPGSPGTNASSLHIPPNHSPPQSQSTSPMRLSFSGRRPNSIQVKKRSEEPNHMVAAMSANKATTSEQDTAKEDEDQIALKQLWDAASQLKLDSAALNNLVARSPSNVSKTSSWSKSLSRSSLLPGRKSKPIDTLHEEGPSSSRPSFSEGRPSLEGLQRVSSKVAGPVIRKLSIKKHSNARRKDETHIQQTGPTSLRPQQPKQDAPQPQPHAQQPPPQPEDKPRNAIVRRTIILPSESKTLPPEIQNLLRKGSTKRRRSASAASTHSIQDRAPTPPPPKSGPGVSGRRFSTDVMTNPMPSTSSSHNNLEVPAAHEKVNSAYDSL
jgi:serine/arginine repetitive matrix protein 2